MQKIGNVTYTDALGMKMSDSPKSLLASRVPQLQFYPGAVGQLYCPSEKVDAYSRIGDLTNNGKQKQSSGEFRLVFLFYTTVERDGLPLRICRR